MNGNHDQMIEEVLEEELAIMASAMRRRAEQQKDSGRNQSMKGREMNYRDQGVGIVLLTPELAKSFLDRNVANYRKIDEGRVSKYAAMIRRHEWNLEWAMPDAIAFDDSGVMTNGQHRCVACVRTGTPFPVIVLNGGPRILADAMDTQKPRSAVQVLEHHGYSNASSLASVVRAYGWITTSSWPQMTGVQVLNFVEKHHNELVESVHYGRLREIQELMEGKAFGGGLHFAFAQADREMAGDFMDLLNEDNGLYKGHPVKALHQQLIKSARHGRVDRVYLAAISIKAWNAFLARRSVSLLKWRGNGAPNEEFPRIDGVDSLIDVFNP